MYLPSSRLIVVTTFLCLFFLFALLEASEVILNEESGVELAYRYVVVTCHQQNICKAYT